MAQHTITSPTDGARIVYDDEAGTVVRVEVPEEEDPGKPPAVVADPVAPAETGGGGVGDEASSADGDRPLTPEPAPEAEVPSRFLLFTGPRR